MAGFGVVCLGCWGLFLLLFWTAMLGWNVCLAYLWIVVVWLGCWRVSADGLAGSGLSLDELSGWFWFDGLGSLLSCGGVWFAGLVRDVRRMAVLVCFGGLLWVVLVGLDGCWDEPESLILAQSERWRHA